MEKQQTENTQQEVPVKSFLPKDRKVVGIKPDARVELNAQSIFVLNRLANALAPLGKNIMMLGEFDQMITDMLIRQEMVVYEDDPQLLVPNTGLVDVHGEELSSQVTAEEVLHPESLGKVQDEPQETGGKVIQFPGSVAD